METFTQIIKDALHKPNDLLTYELSLRMRQIYPDRTILETEDYEFDLKSFVEAGKCQVRLFDDAHPQLEAEWLSKERGAMLVPRNSFQEVLWDGHRFKMLAITYGTCDTRRYYLVSDDADAVRAFFARVCAFSSEVHGEILVYRSGYWLRDKVLLDQIANATLDGMVLAPQVLEALELDFAGFFEAREVYEKQGVAWKRGILMLGPPGNGKTHAIKAMVNRLGRPCLYVRTFKSPKGTVAGNVTRVFHRARQAAPCLLVLEDLDTLIDKDNLSFFLNEMDGFASNHGILTVATTNHPEKLDPAILDRPSRFDRKITFSLPDKGLRRRFLELANAKYEPDLRLSDAEVEKVAGRTKGFSFAYLKELGLSAMMAWMRDAKPGGMARVMLDQAESLRGQMKTKASTVAPEEDED
ncbi:MAG TPA: ATP-binding protein [Fimbriimonadaceae bacterium]|nr:ATP-binding protein [Fimbriimonadaceae bacterium]